MLKIIEMPTDRIGSGYTGEYRRINKIKGVKIYNKDYSLSDLLANAALQWLAREMLVKVTEKIRIPIVFDVVKVKARSGYRLGQVMQHVTGTCGSLYLTDEEYILNTLEKAGIVHDDFHEENLVKTKSGLLYVIDWETRHVMLQKVPKRLQKAAIARFGLGEWEKSQIF